MTATEESVLTIPARVKKDGATYTVTEIPDGDYSTGAFLKSAYTEIILPNTLKKIGNYAFYYSSLTSINIPNGVTSIGRSAFSNCSSLTSITIPNSVTSIGEVFFVNCMSLETATINCGVMG